MCERFLSLSKLVMALFLTRELRLWREGGREGERGREGGREREGGRDGGRKREGGREGERGRKREGGREEANYNSYMYMYRCM